MNTENNDKFDLELWLSAFKLVQSVRLTEDEWSDYFETVSEADFEQQGYFSDNEKEEYPWAERKFVIGYWDMGMFNERLVKAFTEELAMDSFLYSYQPLSSLPPYIARLESLDEVELRIRSGDTSLPEDGQTDRFENFSNKYYEALNN